MTTIKEKAQAYEPPTTKNITELSKIPVDIDLTEKEFTKEDGDKFKVDVFEWDGEEYRMPKSVLKQLQAQLEANPKMSFFKVTKKGEGLGTEYTVIPITE